MLINELQTESVVGGLIALFAAIYAVYRRFQSDKVSDTNLRAEINIIEVLSKQRDDAIEMSNKYRELLNICEEDARNKDGEINQSTININNLKIVEIENTMLRDIINALTDTIISTSANIDIIASNEDTPDLPDIATVE